jgi:hypothetical protein
MLTRRRIAAATAMGWLFALLGEFLKAPDFPAADPIARVDAALIEWLRVHPGSHRALAKDAVFEVALPLVEDRTNRALFATDVDLRETRARRAIHIQRRGDRGAIHADGWNPKAGSLCFLMHMTLDVPAVPLIVLFGASAAVALRGLFSHALSA